MRFLKIGVLLFVCALALVIAANAGDIMGTHDSGRVTFPAPVRVGGVLLPAGDYMVRHTMEGSDQVMVFEPASGKGPHAKAKCQLVQLGNKADQTRTVFDLNAANERVLQELVFRGDTAKHVF
jgi:hypothetical protein